MAESSKRPIFLEPEELQVAENNHEYHMANVNEIYKYIKDASSVVLEFNKQQLFMKKWEEYLQCLEFPKPYVPLDVYFFMEKLKFYENNFLKNTQNFLVDVDEYSVLSQDLLREDLTYSALRRNYKTEYSDEYDKYIDKCLKMLKRIDDYLENYLQLVKCTTEKFNYIKELKGNFQQLVTDLLNNFTYRILCSDKAYLNSIDNISAEYNHENANFQIHIWSLQNVPLRFKQWKRYCCIANLHGIKATLSIPTFIIDEQFSIRALHMNFDHISRNSQSLIEEFDEHTENVNISAQDLITCLENEWSTQLNILERLRREWIQKREEYLQKLRVFKEQVELQRKKIKYNSSGKRIKIILKPPVPEYSESGNALATMRDIFLKEEQAKYDDHYTTILSNADPDEISLKKYFILGGIYQLHQVLKPKNININGLDVTSHFSNSKLVIIEDLVLPPYRELIEESSKTYNKQKVKPYSECPYFILTIHMPEYLCYWGQPLACQFEKVTEEIITPLENVNEAAELSESEQSLKRSSSSDSYINYCPFLIPQKEGLTNSLLELVNTLDEKKILETLFFNIHLVNEKYDPNQRKRDADGILNIRDFALSATLNKEQLKLIETYLPPHIISSFKFNKDIKVSEYERKGKKRIKTREMFEKADLMKMSKHTKLFALGPKQNNPERLVPIYKRHEPIRIWQVKNELYADYREPRSFAQLVKLINFIKWWHKLKVSKILDHVPFYPKGPVSKKRLRPILHQLRASRLKSAESNLLSTCMEDPPERPYLTDKDLHHDKKKDAKTDQKTRIIARWTTKYIIESEYNKEAKTMIIKTDRLGNFGLAFKQYEHFPFKFWQLEPSKEDPDNEVTLTIDTQYITCILNISENGIKCKVVNTTKVFLVHPKMYLNIDVPINNLNELKRKLRERNLNIFYDNDAALYIENGDFTEKHLPTELHTYNCMSLNCTQIQFSSSNWNRYADRRSCTLKFVHYRDMDEDPVEVHITPEQATFVQISEVCTDLLEPVKLRYNLTWRNINFYSDINQLVDSMYPAAYDSKCKNAKLLLYVNNLLHAIRPLSFS